MTFSLELGPYPIVFDGGMGTTLQTRGLDDGGAPEAWNLERADSIREVHQEYLSAGAQVLTTNTFGGTRPRLQMHDLQDQLGDLNRAAAQIAREAIEKTAPDSGALVAGDLGPLGELLEPLGDLTIVQAQARFAEQIDGLIAGGADLILIETMSSLDEVQAAVRAAQRQAPGVPILATMSFDTKLRTMMGITPAEAVQSMVNMGVSAVGANCGRGPEEMEEIMRQMVSARPQGLLLMAQSNAGLPELVGDQFVYTATPQRMAQHALVLADLGVEIIGACCGSTPEHLAAISAALR